MEYVIIYDSVVKSSSPGIRILATQSWHQTLLVKVAGGGGGGGGQWLTHMSTTINSYEKTFYRFDINTRNGRSIFNMQITYYRLCTFCNSRALLSMIFYVTKQHNSPTVKINGQSFSNPHPRSFRITSVCVWCVCVCVCVGGGGGGGR